MSDAIRGLVSGRLLARSVIWNFVGMAAPIMVALFAIPMIIEGMGKERFGLLAIIWMGVGYFSLFDLGLGRTLTKMVAERLGTGNQADLGQLIWTAFILLTLFGVIGAFLLIIFSPFLVTGLLQVPVTLRDEAIAAFRILAVGIPFVIITAGLVGILQAHQRFDVITAIRIPLGILTFAGPLFTLQFTPSIAWATTALLLGRLLALTAYFLTAANVREELRSPQPLERRQVRSLLSFGGWLTVTNIIGPLMTYLDRFFIGAMLGLTAVAYYVTPYEVLSRFQMLPQAVMGVLFPAMAAAHGGDQQRFLHLYASGSKVVYWTMLPIITAVFLFVPEALLIWLGEDFRDMSTIVAYWLAAGWMINTLARPAFTVLQSAGRPDLVAKTHLCELIPYLGLLWWLAGTYGIAGVAAAWSLRVLVDTFILNALTGIQLPALRPQVARSCLVVVFTGGLFSVLLLIESLVFRFLSLLMVTGIAGVSLLPIVRRSMRGGLFSRPREV